VKLITQFDPTCDFETPSSASRPHDPPWNTAVTSRGPFIATVHVADAKESQPDQTVELSVLSWTEVPGG
jgi:hypothetical protein